MAALAVMRTALCEYGKAIAFSVDNRIIDDAGNT
jgi:hypothetical protein